MKSVYNNYMMGAEADVVLKKRNWSYVYKTLWSNFNRLRPIIGSVINNKSHQ